LGKPIEVFHTIQDLWYYDIRKMSMNGATSLCAYCSSSNIDINLLKELVEGAVEYILKQGGAKTLPSLNPSCFTLTRELKKDKPEMKEIARLVKLGHAKHL
jgi:hypothetical protein